MTEREQIVLEKCVIVMRLKLTRYFIPPCGATYLVHVAKRATYLERGNGRPHAYLSYYPAIVSNRLFASQSRYTYINIPSIAHPPAYLSSDSSRAIYLSVSKDPAKCGKCYYEARVSR